MFWDPQKKSPHLGSVGGQSRGFPTPELEPSVSRHAGRWRIWRARGLCMDTCVYTFPLVAIGPQLSGWNDLATSSVPLETEPTTTWALSGWSQCSWFGGAWPDCAPERHFPWATLKKKAKRGRWGLKGSGRVKLDGLVFLFMFIVLIFWGCRYTEVGVIVVLWCFLFYDFQWFCSVNCGWSFFFFFLMTSQWIWIGL